MKTPMKVKVRDAEKILFEGEVDRISSYNEVGRFDIYPRHANFISIINKEIALFKEHQKVKELQVEKAVLKAKKDVVSIFLGIEALVVDDATQNKPTNKPSS
jgi:F0F1-type ATP synthase epsilon subunit